MQRAADALFGEGGSATAQLAEFFQLQAVVLRRPAAARRAPCWMLALLLLLPTADCEYFPAVDSQKTWDPPHFQPWDPLRAVDTSVTVAWTPAWNPWGAVRKYELQARRPAGPPLQLSNLEGLQHRELEMENRTWPGETSWTAWKLVYSGLGRAYTLRIPQHTGHTAQVRVRACGENSPSAYREDVNKTEGCSAWSVPQVAHTVLSAAVDKINFYILGSGKNSMDYTEITVNRQTLYRRRDQTGLVLAIFSRFDFSLQWLESYDTHRDRQASVRMAKDIRRFNQSYFVVVASMIAWEWHATRSLAQTMEYCGAFHFGQWTQTFAEQAHYSSPKSDLQQTASQAEFAHPYAFIGIPGIGAGMGWESLMYNTGQYVSTVGVPKAIVRGVAYYDYVARVYRLQDVLAPKADFYLKNIPPAYETIHNPMPASKAKSSMNALMPPRVYSSYVGTLQMHFTKIIESNLTVPPFNYAFLIITVAGVKRVDPRPKKYWFTELERVWSGKSARYWPNNGTLFQEGLELDQRKCSTYVYYGYAEASPEGCGEDFMCHPVSKLNDFSSIEAMKSAGYVFDWSNRFEFKPEKQRYDLTGRVPLTSYWGMNFPGDGSITIMMKGRGTVTINYGNCWQYSLGFVEVLKNGELMSRAGQLTHTKNITFDFTHKDVIRIQEREAIIVLNSVDIVCWGCCPTTDEAGIIATSCDVGVTPTMCRGLTRVQMQNTSMPLVTEHPYPFRVIPEAMDPEPLQ
mmetsp:Transcript_39847/g.70055  ORF Transcript_39847/g.70055 Transcript_39847/m.70055 type:complete len:741 (+) Transcript_39847:63-2285(+)